MIKMSTEIKPKRLIVAIAVASLPIVVPVLVFMGFVLWLYVSWSMGPSFD